ncbi:S8 family peptidase [Catenovulum agarivorans]|uniref:S8 family peptidase n=1 Tax=Catenovulum agarivorans TaxID=1172192 RepID=UPI0002DF5539|nr:S8 family peptidase [Catenovulum agarivorans]
MRVLRSIPKLRINKPDAIRTIVDVPFKLPEVTELKNNFKVCIFDGGIGDNHVISDWVNEIIPSDVTSSHPSYLTHGSEVCSAFLFGPYNHDTQTFSPPYSKVDLYRVISMTDSDPDLFDVLTRIEGVLKSREYKYANLSLGPHLAVDDDEVHVWTSVLDSILQDGHCLVTVAIGNDGDLEGEYARIQPPSDMVNCFSIGASDTEQPDWQRADYSCVGPGRSPGLVKPDGVIFGGSQSRPFELYSPLTHSVTGTAGTSFASPYALRVAAGIDSITNFDLKPSTIKALMIHHASNDGHHIKDVGWGRLPHSPEEVVQCLEDEAIIVYQGELNRSEHLRIPVPLPTNIDCTWVHLKATFCINAITDPEHPLHYTRSGLDITFRANEHKIKKEAKHASTKPFFTNNNLYQSEEELREDAYKWETCITRSQRFKRQTLENPIFDVKYHGREQGGDSLSDPTPLSYSLIISIRTQGNSNLYNTILQQNQTLQAVQVEPRIRL